MKRKACVMCYRMRPMRKVARGPTRLSWDWACTNRDACKVAFFDTQARANKQFCGYMDDYVRWLGGRWRRWHKRSAPQSGHDIGGYFG